jgi:hypothetical protein
MQRLWGRVAWHDLGCTPLAQNPRDITTKPMNGGTIFKCTFYEHIATALDFNSTNGNRRTQAAAMIKQHAASLHLRTSVPTKLGDPGAL